MVPDSEMTVTNGAFILSQEMQSLDMDRVAMNTSGSTDTELAIAVSQRDPQGATVALSGELDLGSAPKLRDCLAELANVGVINLEIDLTHLDFVDSTGISLFVTDFKRSTASGGSFVVRNAPPQAMRVFEITGLIELLSVSPLEAPANGDGE